MSSPISSPMDRSTDNALPVVGVCASSSLSTISVQEVADAVVTGLPSPATRRVYARHISAYLRRFPGLPTRCNVQEFCFSGQASASSANQSLSAVKKLCEELAERSLLDRTTLSSILSLKTRKQQGVRVGNWLTLDQARAFISTPSSPRDKALLSLLIGCGLRRSEASSLTWNRFTSRWGRWVLADIVGKGQKVRSVAVPKWAADYLLAWKAEQNPTGDAFPVFDLSESGIWWLVSRYAEQSGVRISPHDLRRTYAALSRKGGADIRQIQAELGHSSLTTTEKYLGRIQGLESGVAAGDHIKL